tara:strand:- start:11820 stop:14387 length:2568 start_codon:yes stop_codon:yes gene_type:complete
MSQFSKLTVQIGGHIDGLKKDLKRASYAINSFSKNTLRTFEDTAASASKGFKNVIRSDAFQAAAVAAGGMTLALRSSVKAAIDFESAMADVKKVVDFPTPASFKEMRRDIMRLSREIPISQQGFAEIIAAAGQAGIARKDLSRFAEAAAKMSTAFDISAQEAGEAMAKMRTSMGLSQNEVESLADAMNHLSNSMASSAPQITEFMLRVGAEANKFAFAETQVAAFGSAMIAAGAAPEVAATSFRNLTKALATGTNATKKQQAAFAQLGLSADQVARDMQKDATKTIQDVFRRLGEAPAHMRAQMSTALFGSEARALAPLLTNADLLKEALDSVAKTELFKGSMLKEFEARSKTTANQMQLFQNNMNGLGIAVGGVVLPALNSFMKAITPIVAFVADMADRFPVLTGLVVGLSVAFIGIVAALPFIAAVVSAIGTLKAALAAMAATKAVAGLLLNLKVLGIVGKVAFSMISKAVFVALAPFALIIAKVVLIGAAIFGVVKIIQHFWKTNETFRNVVTGAWNGIVGAAQGLARGIVGIFTGIGDFIKSWGPKILAVLFPIPALIAGLFGKLPADMQAPFDQAVAFIRSIPGKLVDIGGKIIQTIIDGIKQKAVALFDTVKTTLAKVREMLPFSDAKKGPLSKLTESGASIMTTLADGVASKSGALATQIGNATEGGQTKIVGMVQTLVDEFRSVPGLIGDVGELIIDTIIAGLMAKAQGMYQAVKNIFQNVRNLLPFSDAREGPFSQLTLAGGRIITTLTEGLSREGPGLARALAGAFALALPVMQAAPAAAAGTIAPPVPSAASGSASAATTINAPVTINVGATDATAEDIATQVQLVFDGLLSDAEAGVRAFLND